jgi:hypothetical protein
MTPGPPPLTEHRAAAPPGSGSGDEATKDKAKRTCHLIRVEDLIVHHYEKADVLLRRADKIAQEFIDSDLRPGEYSQRIRPGVYRIYLPKLTPEAGQLRTAVIADNISREIRRINPGKVGLPDDADTLVDKRENARTALGLGGIQRTGVKSRHPSIPTDEEMRRQATGAVQLMLQSNRLTLEELVGPGSLEPASSPALSFEPVWRSERHVVSAFRCSLPDPPENSADFHGLTGLTDAQRDALTILQARPILQSVLESGMTCLLIISVHFSTLENGTLRTAYLEALARIPEPHRQFFVLEMIGVPADVSHYRLGEISRYLRGRCRSILCRMDMRIIDFERFTGLGLYAIGAKANANLPDRQQLALMEKFAAGAEKRGLRSYLFGIGRKSLLTAAMGSGFGLLSGSAVIEEVGSPFSVQRAELDALYRTDGYGLRKT